MQDLFLGDSHDITLVNNDLSVRRDALAVTAQSIAIRLKMFLGEWNLNTSIGVPYFQVILGSKADSGLINSLFMAEIQKESNVKTIDRFNVEFKNRIFNIDFIVTLHYGGILTVRNLEFEV